MTKKVKPAYIVDVTGCDDVYDFALAIALAKQKAKQPLTDDNLDIICTFAVDVMLNTLKDFGILGKCGHQIYPIADTVCICDAPRKKPWYKRFGNWLFGRK